jgi:arginase
MSKKKESFNMKINMIGVPIFYGADKRGPEYGPAKLREKKVVEVLERNNHTVYDMGDINIPEAKTYNKYYTHPNLKYVEIIASVNNNLAHSVYSALEADCFPLIVGGDHSVGLGSISGASKYHDDFAVIWMDAHTDINSHETSDTGNTHGMPLAMAMGIGHEICTDVYFKGRKVNPENVYILGARDVDTGEKELIKERNLNVYSAEEMNERGVAVVVDEVINRIKEKDLKAIHVSFDLDYIDAKFVPGTGTPVYEGISIEDTKTSLKMIAETKLVKSMDFVELNVLLDKNDQTADLSIDLLDWTFKHM